MHHALLDEFTRSLAFRADVKAMVTAMLAVDRLGLPTDALRGPFLQQLSGSCDSLKMGDLRRVLMALARCWQASSVHPELLDELCGSIVAKWEELPAWQCDPRNLLAVPQHLGRLRHPHPGLLNCSAGAIAALISSRLSVLPADALRSLDGLLLLAPLVGPSPAQEQMEGLAAKCQLYAATLLRRASPEDLWSAGAQLLAAGVSEQRVWTVWASAAVERRSDGGAAQRV